MRMQLILQRIVLVATVLLYSPVFAEEVGNDKVNPNDDTFLTEEDALRQAFLLPEDSLIEARGNKIYPGSSSNTPTGFGTEWGDVFAGIGYQSHSRFGPKPDGALTLGFGAFEPIKYAALETVINIVDLTGGAAGTVSIKLHRWLGDYSVALGIENFFKWGSPDGGSSTYLAVSKNFRLKPSLDEPFSNVVATLGLGTARYQSDFDKFRNGESGFGIFGSVALQIDPTFSVFAEWTGPDLNLGLSLVPFDRFPIALTIAFADITKSAGEGTRYIAALGYGFKLFGDK